MWPSPPVVSLGSSGKILVEMEMKKSLDWITFFHFCSRVFNFKVRGHVIFYVFPEVLNVNRE
jgi:hypothetical protein